MNELLRSHRDDIERGALMAVTGIGGWVLSNMEVLGKIGQALLPWFTIAAILLQAVIAILKYRKQKRED